MAVWSCYMGVVEDWLAKIPDKQVYITDAPKECIEVLQIFGGKGGISEECMNLGLNVANVVDLEYGWDLRQQSQMQNLKKDIMQIEPKFVTIEMPCTSFSPIASWNPAFQGEAGKKKLRDKRREDEAFLNLTVFVFEQQLARGDHAFFENPRGSHAWATPQLRKVLAMAGVRRIECDMCEHGARHHATGNHIKKPTSLLVTHNIFEQFLAKRCSGHVHQRLEGAATRHSATYSQLFARRVAQAA